MSVGTAFHPRTAPLNRKMQWREWSGYFASSVYADAHDIEYTAIREAAALIDVSPLYKYRVSGPDAERLVDRVIVRDASRLRVGQVYYTCWCDEHGKVIDDGTIHRLGDGEFRWTAADPQYRWLVLNADGLDVEIDDVTDTTAAVALQGPLSRAVLEAATGEDFSDLRYFRRRPATVKLSRRRLHIDVSRTHAHHIHEWEHGGATDISNTVLVCLKHHHAVHEGGWRITPTPGVDPHTSGCWTFTPPRTRP